MHFNTCIGFASTTEPLKIVGLFPFVRSTKIYSEKKTSSIHSVGSCLQVTKATVFTGGLSSIITTKQQSGITKYDLRPLQLSIEKSPEVSRVIENTGADTSKTQVYSD